MLKKSYSGSITLSIGIGLLGVGLLLVCLMHWALMSEYLFGFFPGAENFFFDIFQMSTHVCLLIFMLVFVPFWIVIMVGLSLVVNDHQKLRNTGNSITGLVTWILIVPVLFLGYYLFVFYLRDTQFVYYGETCIPIILAFYACVSLFLPLRELGGEFFFNISVALLFVAAFVAVGLTIVPVNERTGISLLPVELGLLVTFIFLIITYIRTARGLKRIMYKLEHAPYEPIDLSQEFPSPFYRPPKEAKELVLDAEFVEKKDPSKFKTIDGKSLYLLKAGIEVDSEEEEEETFRPLLMPYLEHEKRSVTNDTETDGRSVGKKRGRSERGPRGRKTRSRPSRGRSAKRSRRRSKARGRRREYRDGEERRSEGDDDRDEPDGSNYGIKDSVVNGETEDFPVSSGISSRRSSSVSGKRRRSNRRKKSYDEYEDDRYDD